MTIDNISTKHNVNSYITKTKETYIDLWKNKIRNSTKLEFYKIFKTNYNCEQYLNIINYPIQRRNYTKFRISNHNLMIESGRYGHTKIAPCKGIHQCPGFRIPVSGSWIPASGSGFQPSLVSMDSGSNTIADS